jgi:hypothetical protein
VFSLEMFLSKHDTATCSAVYGLDVASGTKLIN